MNWEVKRDKGGAPVRMVWRGPDHPTSIRDSELMEAVRRNGLPMPAMLEWAEKRGIVEKCSL